MIIRPSDLLGDALGFIVEWLCYWALLGATVGLAVAFYLSGIVGVDQAVLSWLLALLGFTIGFRFDYQDFVETDYKAILAVLGYLSLSLLIMACEVLLVLQYLPKHGLPQ